ncbi:MAG TPA: hypothetical protein VK400_18590 [Pyrinomonadaceae bacterium]|nr:hypothetical protein [Pyrinomonadaceae bacterium]
MKFRFFLFFAILFLLGNLTTVSAQVDSVIGQVTSSTAESFVGGISGDGRFVVFESNGDVATENPRNADGNREVFLFDYAQRRIFQITNTKSLLKDQTMNPIFSNTRVEILNVRPVISNDGRWLAFGSNATTSTPAAPNATNPGNFDANTFNVTTGTTTTNPLTSDGNTELWLYQIPETTPVNLSSGDEIPFVDLNAGTFIRATNTPPSRLPQEGTTTTLPIIADDNRDPSLSDNGGVAAFISNRDLVPCTTTPTATCGNAFPNFDNPEVYTYVRATQTLAQVTATPRGTILAPIYNVNPVISGNGMRVAFLGNGDNPIVGQTGGSNSDRSDEVFYTNLDSAGVPAGARVQVTQTAAANQGDVVNIFSYGPRMSRDGRYIAFESFADLTAESSNGANQTATAVFVYDANTPVTTPATNPFRRVGPRANADAGATGDVLRFPTFSDYDATGAPSSLLLASRLNINASGTIPATASEGLNPDVARPTQVYSYQLSLPPATARFTRLTTLPPGTFIASVQPYASNTQRRISFSLAQVEPGTGNFDLQTETFYLLTPVATTTAPANLNFATGASAIPVTASPVPSPSPTATPVSTPTPTPTGSPTPTVTPTPVTPPAVQGLAPAMLAIVNLDTGFVEPVTPRTAVGSVSRSFPLPIELSGVTMTIGGAACGLKMVSRRQIMFTVPNGVFPPTGSDIVRPVVINNNGTVIRGNVTIVLARPDIFTSNAVPSPGGRARLQNVVNRVPTTEPFNVRTVRIRGGVRVPTVLRLYATGIFIPNAAAVSYSVRIGSVTIQLPPGTLAVQREPGVYTIDFTLPPELRGAGDQPVVLTVIVGGQTFTSRLDDTAPRTSIL